MRRPPVQSDLSCERRPLHVVCCVAGNWLAIAALVWLACKVPAVPAALVFVCIGIQQHALSLWMHEGSHWLIFRNRGLNDAFSNLVLANPLFISLGSYRHRHFLHHRHLGEAQDTKTVIFSSVRGWEFLRFCLRTLLGLRFLTLGGEFVQAAERQRGWWVSVALVQTGIFSAFAWLGHPTYYLWFWVLPFVTVFQVVASLRAVIEHQPLPGESHPFTRTLRPTLLDGLVFCRAGFEHHWMHHHHAGVPYFNLPHVCEHAPTATMGYFETLRALVRGVETGYRSSSEERVRCSASN